MPSLPEVDAAIHAYHAALGEELAPEGNDFDTRLPIALPYADGPVAER